MKIRESDLWNLHNSMIRERDFCGDMGTEPFPPDTVLFTSTDNLLAGLRKSVLILVSQLHSPLILLKFLRSHVLGMVLQKYELDDCNGIAFVYSNCRKI